MEIESAAETTEATESGETRESQSTTAETQSTEAPAQTEGKATVSDSDRLKSLMKISQDPEKANSLTDSDLDFLEKHDFGAKPPKEEAKETKDEPEEGEPEEAKEEPASKPDPALAEALKKVGAKDAKDLVDKIDGLKKQLTGKDAQNVARLTKDVETLSTKVKNETALYAAVKAGNPDAVAHFEKAYGIKVARGEQAQASPTDTTGLIPRDAFIEPESADLVNGVVQQLQEKLKSVTDRLESREKKETESSAKTEATRAAVDEMVMVSGLKGLEEIAGIPNLRKAVEEWYAGKDDPRFEVFQDVMNLANERTTKGLPTDLEAAWAILYARGADLKIAKAKQEGRAEAYNQKPSRTLSGIQGKGNQEYQHHTDAQLKEMSEDLRKAPEDWFDKDTDLPLKSKIPKRAHKYFFREEATA